MSSFKVGAQAMTSEEMFTPLRKISTSRSTIKDRNFSSGALNAQTTSCRLHSVSMTQGSIELAIKIFIMGELRRHELSLEAKMFNP